MTRHAREQLGLVLGLVAFVTGFTGRISWSLLLGAGLYIATTVLAELVGEKGE